MDLRYNLYPLHVFLAVARSASMTQAAGELGISQPAVSAQIKTLEAHLAVSLFERSPRGLRLTERGREVRHDADRLFAQLDGLSANPRDTPPSGQVRVAASNTPAAWMLPERLREFRARCPGVTTRLVVRDSAAVHALVRNGDVALGLAGDLAGTSRGPDLVRELLWADELQLMAIPTNPLVKLRRLTAADVRPHTLILREAGSSTRSHAEWMLRDLLPEFGEVMEIASSEVIKEAALAGLGVAVLSCRAAHREVAAQLLQPAVARGLRAQRSFYLVRRAGRPLSSAAQALSDFLLGGQRGTTGRQFARTASSPARNRR